MSDKQSFWTTLPGILTAIGGIILAVATLVGALHAAGLFTLNNPSNNQDNLQQTSPPINSSATPNSQPLSFYAVPTTVRLGYEVTLVFNQPIPEDLGVYINGKPIPIKQMNPLTLIITIPTNVPLGHTMIQAKTKSGQSASQYISVLA